MKDYIEGLLGKRKDKKARNKDQLPLHPIR